MKLQRRSTPSMTLSKDSASMPAPRATRRKWLPLLACLTWAHACSYDPDDRCGDLHEDPISGRCLCPPDRVFTFEGCVACGANEVPGALGCECAPGYARAAPEMLCEPNCAADPGCAGPEDAGLADAGLARDITQPDASTLDAGPADASLQANDSQGDSTATFDHDCCPADAAATQTCAEECIP